MLDAEDRHVLIKLGPTPEPHEIIALYNYHSLETAICHAEQLQLRLRGPIWSILRSIHNLARRYRLRYEISSAPRSLFDDKLELTLYGKRWAAASAHAAAAAGRAPRQPVRRRGAGAAAHPRHPRCGWTSGRCARWAWRRAPRRSLASPGRRTSWTHSSAPGAVPSSRGAQRAGGCGATQSR